MNHIDITFDLETCATTANAAVMQVAAVAWDRTAKEDPFSVSEGSAFANASETPTFTSFNEHIDLRTCVVDGFDFDSGTLQWWAKQGEEAKKAVCDGLAEPVDEVFIRFIQWMESVKKDLDVESVCLWCQGTDFDAAILRNICKKYDLELPFSYQQFRDARTIILETAVAKTTRMWDKGATAVHPETFLAQPSLAYAPAYGIYKPLPEDYKGCAHDAMYDCIRTTWNVWQALQILSKP